jgi:comEA protein
LRKILDKTGLTKQQQIIIGFLLLGIAGGGILQLSGWKRPPVFDYTDPDKEFERRLNTEFKDLEFTQKDPVTQNRVTLLKKTADSLSRDKETADNNIPAELRGKKININSAYTGDLQMLPGIGEVMAERIIDYREQKGPFKNTEEIKKVKGIGDKKFEQIRDYITVE